MTESEYTEELHKDLNLEKLNYWNYWYETTKHKAWVMWYILKACMALVKRGVKHDLSKYKSIEANGFIKTLPRLKQLTYGSDEYKACLDELQPVLDHHYSNNRHHPEYFDGTLHRMHAIDIIELLCDWRAAVKRHADGDMAVSLGINTKRFEMTELEEERIFRVSSEIGLL
jgi:hypothetical protein